MAVNAVQVSGSGLLRAFPIHVALDQVSNRRLEIGLEASDLGCVSAHRGVDFLGLKPRTLGVIMLFSTESLPAHRTDAFLQCIVIVGALGDEIEAVKIGHVSFVEEPVARQQPIDCRDLRLGLQNERYNPALAHFAKTLEAAAKPPKVIIVAIMRKLLVLANALIAYDRLWQPNPR